MPARRHRFRHLAGKDAPGLPGGVALLVLVLVLPAPRGLPAQDPGTQGPPPPLELLHAGRIERTGGMGDQAVTVLTDSVLFKQADQYVLADYATYIDQQELVTLRGRVRGWDSEWRFQSDEVLYRGRERTVLATGKVEAENLQDGTVVRAAQLLFDRESGEGNASGNPYLYQPPADTTEQALELIGRPGARMRFHQHDGWIEVEGGALVHRGEVTLQGEWMRSDDQPRLVVVRERVRMQQQGVLATGDRLNWDEDAGMARLLGSPPELERTAEREAGSRDSIWTHMTGDSIDIARHDDRLESLRLFGSAAVVLRTMPAQPVDADSVIWPEHMVLKGHDIFIEFDQEHIKRLEAKRAAMYYWRQDAPQRESALGGLDLEIIFSEGEPSRVIARGNATTRYFQEARGTTSEMEWAQGTVIRLDLEGGTLKQARLENADARHYSAEMVRQGRVPMAVHPDSIQVGATRPVAPPRRSPPPAPEATRPPRPWTLP